MTHVVDFTKEVRDLLDQAHQHTAGQIQIWGGQIAADGLAMFLEDWNLSSRTMPYGIWEYAHTIRFDRAIPPDPNLALLERARVFGSDGDLSLRRDGIHYLWHFIGNFPPPDGLDSESFWKDNLNAKFRSKERRALLWGNKPPGGDQWLDDRVARADLTYPHGAAERLVLRYDEFSEGGQVEELTEYA
jgi:hypothetical protein